MTTIQVGTELIYDVEQPTVFCFNIAVGATPHQVLQQENLSLDPPINVDVYQVGLEGNRLHRMVVQPCRLRVHYSATVDLQPEINKPAQVDEVASAQLPVEALPYLNPSRYCQSDLLSRFAFEEFGQLQFGFQRVQTICDWVNTHLDYTPGSTTATTTATDVLLQRTGVCRDYAHLAIALLRGVGIPARYVSGYAVHLQPPDFHGFIEVYLDGGWYLFDPTKLAPLDGLVRIGTGRDAADVAFATLNGSAQLIQKNVWANGIDNRTIGQSTDTDSAVSTT